MSTPRNNDKANEALIAAVRMEDAAEALAATRQAFLMNPAPDVDAKDTRGATALYCAVETGHADVAKLLLEKGANPKPEMVCEWFNSFQRGIKHLVIIALETLLDMNNPDL
jgi:ankyrin repeat protein